MTILSQTKIISMRDSRATYFHKAACERIGPLPISVKLQLRYTSTVVIRAITQPIYTTHTIDIHTSSGFFVLFWGYRHLLWIQAIRFPIPFLVVHDFRVIIYEATKDTVETNCYQPTKMQKREPCAQVFMCSLYRTGYTVIRAWHQVIWPMVVFMMLMLNAY